jgi:hypothetical protein
MRTKEELIREIEDRNKARAEAGLPLVSVPKEVEKISEAELWRDYCDWYNASPLRAKVAEEVLQKFRKDRGDPTWVPRKLLNGAMAYGSEVQGRLLKIWREEAAIPLGKLRRFGRNPDDLLSEESPTVLPRNHTRQPVQR